MLNYLSTLLSIIAAWFGHTRHVENAEEKVEDMLTEQKEQAVHAAEIIQDTESHRPDTVADAVADMRQHASHNID